MIANSVYAIIVKLVHVFVGPYLSSPSRPMDAATDQRYNEQVQTICFIMNFIGAEVTEFSLGPWPPLAPPWNRPWLYLQHAGTIPVRWFGGKDLTQSSNEFR